MAVIEQGARVKPRIRRMRPSDFMEVPYKPIPDAAKKTFKRIPLEIPRFGRKLPVPERLPSRLPRLPALPISPLRFLDIAEELDRQWEWYRSPHKRIDTGPGWIPMCQAGPAGWPYICGPYSGGYNGAFEGCLDMQAFGHAEPGWNPAPAGFGGDMWLWMMQRNMVWEHQCPSPPDWARYQYSYTFRKREGYVPDGVYPREIQPALPLLTNNPLPNPNLVRGSYNDPQPIERQAEPEPAASPARQGWSSDGRFTRPENRRPYRNEDEKKTRNIGKRLLDGFDRLSEASEVIDAVYEALPASIRAEAEKRWRDEQAFIDQAGQYGIDRADEKLRVLWEHWDKLDAQQAWKNIAANALEDQIHGAKHKALPRNWGNASQNADKAFGEFVNDFVSVFT